MSTSWIWIDTALGSEVATCDRTTIAIIHICKYLITRICLVISKNLRYIIFVIELFHGRQKCLILHSNPAINFLPYFQDFINYLFSIGAAITNIIKIVSRLGNYINPDCPRPRWNFKIIIIYRHVGTHWSC